MIPKRNRIVKCPLCEAKHLNSKSSVYNNKYPFHPAIMVISKRLNVTPTRNLRLQNKSELELLFNIDKLDVVSPYFIGTVKCYCEKHCYL